jgi:AraC-like DNA-binding protein
MNVILLLAPIQAFFLFSLLAAKRQKSFVDKVLMAWLVGIGAHTLIYFLHFQYQLSVPLVLNLNSAFPFLQGPFLLAYVVSLVGMRQRFAGLDYLHLLPFASFVLYMAVSNGMGTFSVTGADAIKTVSIFSISDLFAFLLFLSVPVYIAWSLVIMRRARLALPSPTQSSRFRWIWSFIAGLGIVWITAMAAAWLNQSQLAQPHMIFWALTIVVYVLGYLGLTRTTVFTASEFETLKEELQPKYRKSGLKPAEAQSLYAALVAHVDEKQAYLDPDISLGDLAAELEQSTNHVSQVINEFDQCNFHDFINSRRVAEACRRMEGPQETNLLELAMAVGFNSKSSFNRAFRKFAGVTPSEYMARP